MTTFTAFCQDVEGRGTIWIESIEARHVASAINKARKACAEAWECPQSSIHVLGISEGSIKILHWEDIGE